MPFNSDCMLDDKHDVDRKETKQHHHDYNRVTRSGRINCRHEIQSKKKCANCRSDAEDKVEVTDDEVRVVVGEVNSLIRK